jgi:hypothetical protein
MMVMYPPDCAEMKLCFTMKCAYVADLNLTKAAFRGFFLSRMRGGNAWLVCWISIRRRDFSKVKC